MNIVAQLIGFVVIGALLYFGIKHLTKFLLTLNKEKDDGKGS